MTTQSDVFHGLFERAKSDFIHKSLSKEEILETLERVVEAIRHPDELKRVRFVISWKELQHAKKEIAEVVIPQLDLLERKFSEARTTTGGEI